MAERSAVVSVLTKHIVRNRQVERSIRSNGNFGVYLQVKNKVAIITGASDGIGKAVAEELSKNGFQLLITSKSADKLSAVAQKTKAEFFVFDISQSDAVEDFVAYVKKKYGRVDLLVNNAGTWLEGELDTNKPGDISRVINVNLLGQIYLTREVVPIMKKQKSGLIINIVSQAGIYAKAERSVYNASKFGMTGFTKAMSAEMQKYGVRVTGIYPAKVNTELFSKVGVKKDMKDAMTPKDIADAVMFVVSRPDSINIIGLEFKSANY